MWSVKGMSNEDAKILALWQSGTLSILQLLIERTETEGAWLKLHQSQIYDSYILNIASLTPSERTLLLELFDELSSEEFPSIIDQFIKRYPLRIKIDKAIFRVLGLTPAESEAIINKLYPALADEINQLRSLMSG